MRRPIRRQAGFTLVELAVGVGLAMFFIAAAFSFAGTQTRGLTRTTEEIYVTEIGRTTLDVLTDEIRHAGVGVGYAADGTFAGVYTGSFVVGGVTFTANNGNPLALENAPSVPTDDIGLLTARGGYATVADFSQGGTAQLCQGSGVKAGDRAIMRSESGLSAMSVLVSTIGNASGCTRGVCSGGCQNFTWTPIALWSTHPEAGTVNYVGGELVGGLSSIVWFVEASDPDRPNIGALRRAVFDGTATCTARDHHCGELVAENVETLQMDVWRFDSASSAWVNMTGQALQTTDRLRIDIELVVRARTADTRPREPVTLRLAPDICLPATCQPDNIGRAVFRASAEVLNSGRMSIH